MAAEKKPLPRFHFVDENDPEKRHKSRAHLARELHRMKRQHRKVHLSNLAVSHTDLRFDQFKWPIDVALRAACPPTVHLPLHLLQTASDRCLFHHYTTVMPELYRARWKHMGDANAVRDLFQLYSRDEVSFRAMLFDAATHRSALQGIHAPLEYENQLLRSVRSNLHTPSTGVILGTALLGSLKCMEGADGASHWLAFREMISLHGGLSSFVGDYLMFTKLVWTFVALPGPLTGFDFAPDPEAGLRDLNDLLRSRQKALVDLLPTSEADMDRLTDLKRIKAFQASTMKKLLQTPTSEHPTERNCRLAVILFLTSALMQHGDFDPATDSCIDAISQHLEEARDDASISPVHLMWFLVRLSVSASIGERYAQVWIGIVRMLAAFHRLAPPVQDNAERLLFTSLEMPEMVDRHIHSGWGLDAELKIDADPMRRWVVHGRSVPAECFCELLWFTAPPDG
ncbi:hypothetical protein Z517_07079 [Fonsecaea pedrosoi CBS 271.37]|uniref:Uncharacterized protein n=1 Tax=Fonsecaea pedrosoi CBS 271.37 TaxID=1442368 RepID=A0A0D2GI36_9EURO|nr:uncharacterized protein Z517_07079 [Fonsecaea pedrosoi CBS 271.37]KIW80463.1 hypothetical protein Z517_07079 [Fonsecaea pedrosoi CBS 271.37]